MMVEQTNDQVFVRPHAIDIGAGILKMTEDEARKLAIALNTHFARLEARL